MTCLRGRSRRGARLKAGAPFGHWATQTFIAGLRCDGLVAPWVVDQPMNRQIFDTYVETQLVPTLQPGDVVKDSERDHDCKDQDHEERAEDHAVPSSGPVHHVWAVAVSGGFRRLLRPDQSRRQDNAANRYYHRRYSVLSHVLPPLASDPHVTPWLGCHGPLVGNRSDGFAFKRSPAFHAAAQDRHVLEACVAQYRLCRCRALVGATDDSDVAIDRRAQFIQPLVEFAERDVNRAGNVPKWAGEFVGAANVEDCQWPAALDLPM